MRILVTHNRYQQAGGEDVVASSEADLLASHGHTVERLTVDNDHIKSGISKIGASINSIYSFNSSRLLKHKISEFRPDVVHVHNFFPTLSPSVFYACSEVEVPVVHTLHNYRIVCASATLFRDGVVCEECIQQQSILPGIKHACYRSSHFGSAVSGLGMAIHDRLQTWSEKVSAYIALTDFAADKLGGYRIPRDRIHVKPNAAIDRGLGIGDGNYAIYVGRLTQEKGVQTLIDADAAGLLCMDVVILGDGPMKDQLERSAERIGSRLNYKGFLDRDETFVLMRRARVLIVPSIWYEGCPLVIIEALSLGLPVIGANLGSVATLVHPGETGLLFEPGSPESLSHALRQFAINSQSIVQMRRQARDYYVATHTPEKNYQRLIEIYDAATSV